MFVSEAIDTAPKLGLRDRKACRCGGWVVFSPVASNQHGRGPAIGHRADHELIETFLDERADKAICTVRLPLSILAVGAGSGWFALLLSCS